MINRFSLYSARNESNPIKEIASIAKASFVIQGERSCQSFPEEEQEPKYRSKRNYVGAGYKISSIYARKIVELLVDPYSNQQPEFRNLNNGLLGK